MAKIDFYTLNKVDKEAIFREIGTQKGMNPGSAVILSIDLYRP